MRVGLIIVEKSTMMSLTFLLEDVHMKKLKPDSITGMTFAEGCNNHCHVYNGSIFRGKEVR